MPTEKRKKILGKSRFSRMWRRGAQKSFNSARAFWCCDLRFADISGAIIFREGFPGDLAYVFGFLFLFEI